MKMYKSLEDIDELGLVLLEENRRNKNIRISVYIDCEIKVSYPSWVGRNEVLDYIKSNKDTIKRLLKVQQDKRMKFQNSSKQSEKFTLEELFAIRTKAKKTLFTRLAFLSKDMNENLSLQDYNLHIKNPYSYSMCTLRNNKSNWGSCSSKKNINLNIHLSRIPEILRDYVMVHELCHLVYLNHGKQFHELVNRYFNGREKELNNKLKQYSPSIPTSPLFLYE